MGRLLKNPVTVLDSGTVRSLDVLNLIGVSFFELKQP
jgi:hypothetical protein